MTGKQPATEQPGVLLLHRCPASFPRPTHFDLFWQQAEILAGWAIAAVPAAWLPAGFTPPLPELVLPSAKSPSRLLHADRQPPHRLAYLTLEGPLSGDRGEVTRLASFRCYPTSTAGADISQLAIADGPLAGVLEVMASPASSTAWPQRLRWTPAS